MLSTTKAIASLKAQSTFATNTQMLTISGSVLTKSGTLFTVSGSSNGSRHSDITLSATRALFAYAEKTAPPYDLRIKLLDTSGATPVSLDIVSISEWYMDSSPSVDLTKSETTILMSFSSSPSQKGGEIKITVTDEDKIQIDSIVHSLHVSSDEMRIVALDSSNVAWAGPAAASGYLDTRVLEVA